MTVASESSITVPRHIVAVMGVVRAATGSILLVKTHVRGWEPPGGQVEQGEDLVSALQREIREESGCTVSVRRLVGVYSNIGAPEKVMFTFQCDYFDGQPTTSEETPEVGFFTVAEALRLVAYPSQALKLREALDDATGVAYRVYRTRPFALVSEQRC